MNIGARLTMTLPSHPFTGANFFASIRFRMDTNRGLFGGSDGDLQYVIMDAVLYRVEIFRSLLAKVSQ